ncbi:hypothetical protein [Cytobacillus sp. IB215316]|uniref:hypothetical protein n=1 Tax=Cytobacillus sp. IB215316 TaxID=3097354 RepID=UPI002A111958|nr:hypothetical protein [Cytobacillus sp. IB215316]MDX8362607.1 hypothetical protein [Cytobacillus sp. IB215316]
MERLSLSGNLFCILDKVVPAIIPIDIDVNHNPYFAELEEITGNIEIPIVAITAPFNYI